MERRFVAFLAISFLVLMLNSMFFAPPVPPRKELPPENVPPREQAEQPVDNAPPAELAEGETPPAEPSVSQPAVDVGPEDNKGKKEEENEKVDLEYVTLGSAAEDSPYRLLVTLTNAGAGVRRIELSSSRYRDLQDRGGYLGQMEAATDPRGGILVQVVGAGTPAALAGLQVGDRIVSAASAGPAIPLQSVKELTELLAHNKPGRHLTLEVVRGDNPPIECVAILGRRPLEVIRPESENVLMRTDKLPPGFVEPPSFQFTFEQLDKLKIAKDAEEIIGIALRESHWEIATRDETSVTFRKRLPGHHIEVLKRYRLEQVPADQRANANYPGYGLTLDLEVHNLAAETRKIVYRLDGPNGLPLEGWWYANKISRSWSSAGIRDVVARYEGNETVQFGPAKIAAGKVDPMQGRPLAFIGVDAQYFSAVLLPMKPSLSEMWIDEARTILLGPPPKARSIESRYANVTCRLISRPVTLQAQEVLRHSYQVFVGPKRPKLLAQYHACESTIYTLGDLMYYGWFGPVAKAMLGILHFFHSIVRNYGLSIILLTVLVRSCMFPVSRKQAQSMAKMQELKPEMDKLKEKYKSDMQKQSQAMQELYRKHKINPMAGCLPMFIQMPVFLGLYRALMVDVELRQAPLLGDSIRWCSNLAAPDMFFDWSPYMPAYINSGVGIFGLGPYLNILPLLTCSLFLLQQKMFMPEPANDQAAMQQKLMKYMMVFMGLLFFKVASGLCLYFIASSLWGIAERKMLPSPTAATSAAATATPVVESRARGGKNGQAQSKRRAKSKRKR